MTLHEDLTKPSRFCSTHKKTGCPLGEIHGAIGGISCKDFCKNRLTGAQCDTSVVYMSSSSPGRSADCMHGFMGLLLTSPPDYFLLENSDELANNPQHQESLNLFCCDMAARSYDVRVFTADAFDFALPEKRVRTYIIGLQRPLKHWKVTKYTEFFQNLEKLIKAFMMQPLPLAEVLYPENHPSLEAELEQRKSKTPCNSLNANQLNEQRVAWMSLGLRSLPGLTRVPEADASSPWFRATPLRKRSCFEIIQHKGRARLAGEEKKLQALAPNSPLEKDAKAHNN